MKSGSFTPILLLVLLGAFFYFVVLRPQRKRQAETATMQKTLAPGVEVMTTAGLYGTVVDIADDVVTLEVSPGVTHRYVRAAIAKVLPTETGEIEHEHIDPDEHEDADDHEWDDSDASDADPADEDETHDEAEDDDGDEPPTDRRPEPA